MKFKTEHILFIHQNFPGQFRHLAPALELNSKYTVSAMTMKNVVEAEWQGVRICPYSVQRGSCPDIHPWLSDFETKTIRAEACFRAALSMKQDGYKPDVIIAHPGWGESLFLKEIWPESRLGIYCEFFYPSKGVDVEFDPEFPLKDPGDSCRMRLKNLNNIMHFDISDGAISPTKWQASTYPMPFRDSIAVVHDGIDTDAVRPDESVELFLNSDIRLTVRDEIITFVNRNLEPYRGYHIFMRALPEILKRRPKARVLIVGGDGVSYGAAPEGGKSWKQIFIEEIRSQIEDSDWRRVHFLGNVSYQHFIALLQLSSVHVYLTYPFVLSWSLLEAMSAGCAIVASDTQPVHEAISHDVTGRLVDFFDFKALASEVCFLLDDENARKRLGRAARAHAVLNYDLRRVCLPRQLEWVEALFR